ncbi:MAG TPA: hypothetical protein VGR54_07290 [Nitrosopumilaceae archaeon]|nr:hypothetical protein [Nitrosopumilaceae archaeon]
MKEPHNYRKVGYSMIVISVSLTVIGLITWSIGSNYHFGTGLMAGQEIDAMTPKQGYNIISFDYVAPVGAKLKLLDHTDSINDAKKLQNQYQQSVNGFQILIFGNSRDSNVDLMAHAEVAAFTPTQGYNVVFFNNAMPVGAKLSMNKHDNLLVNATADEQEQQKKNTDPEVSVIIFSSSYADNLKMVLGTGASILANVQPMQNTQQSATIANTSTKINSNSNESVITSQKLNNTNSVSPQTGQKTLAITEQVNATSTTNQTTKTTNNTQKSVNLGENIGVISK